MWEVSFPLMNPDEESGTPCNLQLPPFCRQKEVYLFVSNYLFIIFGYTESSLPRGLFSSYGEVGLTTRLLWYPGFSLQSPLLLQSTGSQALSL